MLFEFQGLRACFTRPELKVERYSYDVPTPAALRGMISAIYWHPSIEWKIDKIYVLNKIRHEIIKRNEVGKIIPSIRSAEEAFESRINANKFREQRSSRILMDVHYVVDAHFEMRPDKAGPDDNPDKVVAIVARRLEKGQCFSTPYMGCREFSCAFGRWPEEKAIPAIDDSKDFGIMLYDLDYSDPSNIRPMYFHAVMDQGVIDVGNAEVLR